MGLDYDIRLYVPIDKNIIGTYHFRVWKKKKKIATLKRRITV